MVTLSDTYKSIQAPSTGVFKDRGSKFLAFAYPVSTEDEIKELVDALKKQYHDARHHCYAYRLGSNNFRANDDGEPSNSAGKPILNQIDANNLSNILVVVVRYFGGTLLGVGGLINAYKNASADALSQATFIKKTIDEIYQIEYPYESTNEIMRIVNDENLKQHSPVYKEMCRFTLHIPKNSVNRVLSKLHTIDSVKIEYLKTQ
ncbi:MAG: YigZ family protein [Bacteroidales bacterium]|nr:YigZ family protein [Bacteroidales bacterium]